MPDLIA